jgi:hypothetical protein
MKTVVILVGIIIGLLIVLLTFPSIFKSSQTSLHDDRAIVKDIVIQGFLSKGNVDTSIIQHDRDLSFHNVSRKFIDDTLRKLGNKPSNYDLHVAIMRVTTNKGEKEIMSKYDNQQVGDTVDYPSGKPLKWKVEIGQ